jgi:hypothetical protein
MADRYTFGDSPDKQRRTRRTRQFRCDERLILSRRTDYDMEDGQHGQDEMSLMLISSDYDVKDGRDQRERCTRLDQCRRTR